MSSEKHDKMPAPDEIRRGDAEVDALKKSLNLEQDAELAKHFNVDATTVTKWRERGLSRPFKRRLRQEAVKAAGASVTYTIATNASWRELQEFTPEQLAALFPGISRPIAEQHEKKKKPG